MLAAQPASASICDCDCGCDCVFDCFCVSVGWMLGVAGREEEEEEEVEVVEGAEEEVEEGGREREGMITSGMLRDRGQAPIVRDVGGVCNVYMMQRYMLYEMYGA